MNIAEASIRYKTVTLVATVAILVGGVYAYQKLGRLEDPEFTIKEAQIITHYPGASAAEVADEVTDELETAIQQMGQLKKITSISEPGKSTIRAEMKDRYDKQSLPQVWDELRRKVGDARANLPPGVSEPLVIDDYGDVYGVLFAVYGDGYSYAELKEYVDLLRRELLLVQDVAKISIQGSQNEVVYVEISRARLAQLGLEPETIYRTLSGQNLVAPSGKVEVGPEYIRLSPTGELASVEDLGNLLIVDPGQGQSKLYLRDIATIRRGYVDPPGTIVRFNGKPAIALGISTVPGGNVVVMGEAIVQRLRELVDQTPIGIEFGRISVQSEAVTAAIDGFMISLAESLAIVIGVLMIAMGLRSGLLIGIVLLLTVLLTFIVMWMFGILLERISLGALIIALGMLVDNAIVVVEGILVNLQRGMDRLKAAGAIVQQTLWPLLGATAVAILAFAAIGASQDSTGEYCRSLFLVILISLLSSWVLAITITPLLGVMMLKAAPPGGQAQDPYAGALFRGYRAFLEASLNHRRLTAVVLLGLLALAVWGFGTIPTSFFPDSTRPQFMVHYWLPQGTHITRTDAGVNKLVEHVRTLPGVTHVSSFTGGGASRFLLTYGPEEPNSAYGLLLVDVDDYRKINTLMAQVTQHAFENYPSAQCFCRRFVLGPGEAGKIQARFRGSDPDTLRRLSEQAQARFYAVPLATDIQTDWRNRVPLIEPRVAEAQARSAGVTRSDIAKALNTALSGTPVGVFREEDELLPIVARAPLEERSNVDHLNDVVIYSPVAGRSIPLRQLVMGFESGSENSILRRRNRLPTITVKCDPAEGLPSALFEQVRPSIEAMELPGDCTLEWGGEYEDTLEANAALMGKIPIVAVLMFFTVVVLFNSLRQPTIIFLTVPLAVIGVTAGLMLFDQPFGFMAMLGFMSLSGMLIKNAIVLIDEINAQWGQGKGLRAAIVDSGVSRVRPVSMAALTTVLGMIPLVTDAFFVSMAVTIMMGLTFATVLTLIVVPLLYLVFYAGRTETARKSAPGA